MFLLFLNVEQINFSSTYRKHIYISRQATTANITSSMQYVIIQTASESHQDLIFIPTPFANLAEQWCCKTQVNSICRRCHKFIFIRKPKPTSSHQQLLLSVRQSSSSIIGVFVYRSKTIQYHKSNLRMQLYALQNLTFFFLQNSLSKQKLN